MEAEEVIGPCLIAETCSAGHRNHRFLVPEGACVTDIEASRVLSRARECEQGANYLAVLDRHVLQSSTGRFGDDVLVLVGIDVGRLSDAEKAELVRRLGELLPKLRDVVERIDWERDGAAAVVPRVELNEWYGKELQPLVHGPKGAPAREGVLAPLRIAVAGILFLVLISTALLARRLLLSRPGTDADEAQHNQALERLADACGAPSAEYASLDRSLRSKFLLPDVTVAVDADDRATGPAAKHRFLAVATPLYELLIQPNATRSSELAFLLDQQFGKEVAELASSADNFRYLVRHPERQALGQGILRQMFAGAPTKSVARFRRFVNCAREAVLRAEQMIDADERPKNARNVLRIVNLPNDLACDARTMPVPQVEWNFFVFEDASAAEILHRWFCGNPNTTDIIGRHNNLGRALTALASQKDKIEHQSDADVPESHPPVLQALLELANAADDVANGVSGAAVGEQVEVRPADTINEP